MIDKINKYNIILASQSPRRQDLLSMTGIKFEVKVIPDIDESVEEDIFIDDIPLYLALKKQKAYEAFWSQPDNIIITADTIVSLDNNVINKPNGRSSAIEILTKLSGKEHHVITGVAIKSANKEVTFSTVTHVWFKDLLTDQIEYYVDTYKPFDKAGAYGIQEWIGLIGISRIDGSFYNVVGLPVDRVYEELVKF